MGGKSIGVENLEPDRCAGNYRPYFKLGTFSAPNLEVTPQLICRPGNYSVVCKNKRIIAMYIYYDQKRIAEQVLSNILQSNKAIIILGARQVGKTTLIQRALPAADTAYLNLDIPRWTKRA